MVQKQCAILESGGIDIQTITQRSHGSVPPYFIGRGINIQYNIPGFTQLFISTVFDVRMFNNDQMKFTHTCNSNSKVCF